MKLASRRTFLGQLASIPVLFSAGRLQMFALPGMDGRYALQQQGIPALFPHPEIIRYDSQCFTIHGRDTFIYSASFHYCRTPKELWRDRMMKLKLAGFNTIETYAFWNYHEPVEGSVDMTALEEFVALARELGVWMILRVGPYVCAEWDAGGFPHWVIEKQFPLRSDAPESIATSQGWYNHVLPIVRENMIATGGPVIMIQIENEYDYWKLPDTQKMAYLTALAHMVWNAGIDVPIITNWASQARQNKDPVMARIMDTGDFYPRWNVVKEVVPALEKLRKEEPKSPVGIAELQGGWFSQYGGKLSEDQDGVNAAQLNLLTKTVIETGATFLNFYMGHGGTNFDWAARKVTTTYDYAAPLREPGGLWDKYYAARNIGSFLDKFGPMVARTRPGTGATCTNTHVSVSFRKFGESGVLFVRENADAAQEFSITFPDPVRDGKYTFTVPRQGKLAISPRGMKMIPIQVPIPGGHLRYSTAEILDHGSQGDRHYLIVYGQPSELVEIALAANSNPRVQGPRAYQHFDAETQTAILGFHIGSAPQMFLWNGKLQIVALPSELAGKTWTAELPALDGGQERNIPVITDCALMASHSQGENSAVLTLEYLPGEHNVILLAPTAPEQCLVDGSPVKFQYDARWQSLQLKMSAPQLPLHETVFTEGECLVERFDPSVGDWVHTAPVALEKLGRLPYGYVKYRTSFTHRGEEMLILDTFTEDDKQVFLNGKHVPELSQSKKSVSCRLGKWVKDGPNILEVSYEAFGSENGNAAMSELKGLRAIRIGTAVKAAPISMVAIQRFPPALETPEMELRRMPGVWSKCILKAPDESKDLVPGFTWFRTTFSLSGSPAWFCPWKLKIESDRDALLYLNGKFVGYYKTIGPQLEFYLPEPYLFLDGSRQNVLTVILAYTDSAHPLKQLSISPYMEFATHKMQLEVQWKPNITRS